jgi:hypothetical protein
MTDGTPQQPTPSGTDNTSAEQDIEGQGGEGTRKAEATPPIADDAEKGQTTTPAPEDDAGSASG